MADAPRPQAVLDERDPELAKTLKNKILKRLADMPRHHTALRAAMAEFGEDFDLEPFAAAYQSDDPAELNRVKAVERGIDLLFNYVAELAAFGLELAGVRTRDDQTNSRRDLDALRNARVVTGALADRLQRLRRLRVELVHDYPVVAARQVHEAARLVADNVPAFREAYRAWIGRGFDPGG